MEIINIADIVEENGKTIRENNEAKIHNIPLGTLVEINHEGSDVHRMRMYVIQHDRDCDGTPLYSLGKKDQVVMPKDCGLLKYHDKLFFNENWYENANIVNGYGEDSLLVIGDRNDYSSRFPA